MKRSEIVKKRRTARVMRQLPYVACVTLILEAVVILLIKGAMIEFLAHSVAVMFVAFGLFWLGSYFDSPTDTGIERYVQDRSNEIKEVIKQKQDFVKACRKSKEYPKSCIKEATAAIKRLQRELKKWRIEK